MPKLTVGMSALEGDNSDFIVGEGGGPGEAVDTAVLPDGKTATDTVHVPHSQVPQSPRTNCFAN